MNRISLLVLASTLVVSAAALAQQTTSPAAPQPGTVPVTSQTPVRPGVDTAPSAAPSSKKAMKHRVKRQKRAEKAATADVTPQTSAQPH